MSRIFLSYRRDDSQDVTGRIYDRLVAHFGKDAVFIDVDTIPVGIDYRIYLSQWISGCDAVLVVIGNAWLGRADAPGGGAGQRRLDDPGDFVRVEVATALSRDIPVVPLLVSGAKMPEAAELPEDIIALAFRNGVEVRSGRDFHTHVDRLIADVERVLTESRVPTRDTVQPQSGASAPPPGHRVTASVDIKAPSVAWPTNLGFEDADSDGMPTGWFDGFHNVDGVSKFPVRVVPRDECPGGRCVQIRKTRADARAFGTVMQRCPAASFRGRTLRVEADLKSERLQRWAGLWLRIDGPSGQLFFDRRRIRGSEPWGRLRIDTRVPPDAEWLNYGVLLVANGTVWADAFALTVDPGADVFTVDFA